MAWWDIVLLVLNAVIAVIAALAGKRYGTSSTLHLIERMLDQPPLYSNGRTETTAARLIAQAKRQERDKGRPT